ncbi:hypothetical protein F5144DRAFT_476054, partial [Chaetomium tenue]
YLVANKDLTTEISDHMRVSDAASLGVEVYTVGQALYPTAPMNAERFPTLIYRHSMVVGSVGIQIIAKLPPTQPVEVITTCSPHNFDFVESLNANKLFIHNSPAVGSDIREYIDNKPRYVQERAGRSDLRRRLISFQFRSTMSPPTQTSSCARTSTPSSSLYISSATGHVSFGILKLSPPQDFEFANGWALIAAKLFADKKVVPH